MTIASFLPERDVYALALVVPTTAYHAHQPIVISIQVKGRIWQHVQQ